MIKYIRYVNHHYFLLLLNYLLFVLQLDHEERSREKDKFVQGFSDNVDEGTNVTELIELGRPLAEKILKYWMEKINRNLTNSQVTPFNIYSGAQFYNFITIICYIFLTLSSIPYSFIFFFSGG